MPLDDKRLRRVPHWQDTVTMPVYESLEDWERRKAEIRRRVLFAAGLFPTPSKAPLNPLVTGEIERDGYAIRNVGFESFPGFYCTGNLYVPHNPVSRDKIPVVLSPHGHGQWGRFSQGEHIHAPARFINFALQGYYVFAPDMVGLNDSKQIVPHRGYDDDALHPWGIGTLGLQLWNNIRALDYLLTLPNVDATRVAVTGESGGATQTYLLAAVDDRVGVASPVNMLSAHYAGGCVCENAPALRLGVTNMEIVATFSPKPLLLVAATGDWTVNTPRVEYPAVRSIYQLYGAEDALECVQYDAPHNYNLASRQAVYGFLAKHLGGRGKPAPDHPSTVFSALRSTPLMEAPNSFVEDTDALRVFPDALPEGALPNAAAVTEALKARLVATAASADSPERDAAYRLALGAELPGAADLTFARREQVEVGGFTFERFLLGTKRHGEQIPSVLIRPAAKRETPTLLLADDGIRQWLETDTPVGEAIVLLHGGHPVLLVDLFLTGSYHSPAGATGRPTTDPHFTTYNRTDAQWRIQDILTAATALAHLADAPQIDIRAEGESAALATLAGPLLGECLRNLQTKPHDGQLPYVPHLERMQGFGGAAPAGSPKGT